MTKRLSLSRISDMYRELHHNTVEWHRLKRQYILMLSQWIRPGSDIQYVRFLLEPMRSANMLFVFPEAPYRGYTVPSCLVDEVLSEAGFEADALGAGCSYGGPMARLNTLVKVPDDAQDQLLSVLCDTEMELKERGSL